MRDGATRAETSEAEALEARRELEAIGERAAQDDPVRVMEGEAFAG